MVVQSFDDAVPPIHLHALLSTYSRAEEIFCLSHETEVVITCARLTAQSDGS